MDLKTHAEKDAQTLEDTISMNQVLIEEIKVKDAIIEADKILQKEPNTDKVNDQSGGMVACNECEWKTNIPSHLQGHKIKHSKGQYACEQCRTTYLTKQELNNHMNQSHENQPKERDNECDQCDRTFESEHSLKQHKQSKHKTTPNLPVGHPDRAQTGSIHEKMSLDISCVQCGKRFTRGADIDLHMLEHIEEQTNGRFETPYESRTCRYFRDGFCKKGESCRFSHKTSNKEVSLTPRCSRGQNCPFMMQNRCIFFHPGVGVQVQGRQPFRNKECRYKDACRNIQKCSFSHTSQDFQYVQTTRRRPIAQRTLNAWLDY